MRPFRVATFRHSWDHARGGATVEVREDENIEMPEATCDPQNLACAMSAVLLRRDTERRLRGVLARVAALLPPPATDRWYCAECGHRIEPKPGRKYCGSGCRARAWKWEHRNAPKPGTTAPKMGTEAA